jgi:hypothetical protein
MYFVLQPAAVVVGGLGVLIIILMVSFFFYFVVLCNSSLWPRDYVFFSPASLDFVYYPRFLSFQFTWGFWLDDKKRDSGWMIKKVAGKC